MSKNATVDFKSAGLTCVGDLYLPEDFDQSLSYPAVVCGGPMATVTEQAAGVFAEALARRGYITLAFDYRRFGESEGEPRSYEDPASKTEDITSALGFLRAHPNVDRDQIAALAICASASYMAPALVGAAP